MDFRTEIIPSDRRIPMEDQSFVIRSELRQHRTNDLLSTKRKSDREYDRNVSQNVRRCALIQAARQGLSARISFASANNMFNFTVRFRRPRYRVFRNRSCFATAKTCSTLARTEDFSRSLCSGSIGVVLALGWTTIDFVTNALST